MEKVAILLSTYNGEKYLEEQIESILNQTYKNIEIYIRDDGSKDKTIEILNKYKEEYDNIYLEIGQNVGFINSFFNLLDMCNDATYYAYCDQDDIWEKQKIEKAVEYLQKTDENKPAMFFSNVDYYDENMQFVGHADKKKVYNFRNSLVECVSQGMTMVINKNAKNIISKDKPKNCLFHDWWTYMICSGFGEIVYDEESLVRYRRHGKSVTAEGKNFISLLFWRIKKFIVNDDLKKIKKQYIEYQKLYEDRLNIKDRKLLYLFTSEKYSFVKSIKKVFYPKRFRKKIIDEIMVRFLFLIGKI